jgi:hypothetical protein
LAILALIGYFVNTPAAFWIALAAYIVGALGVLVDFDSHRTQGTRI